MQISFCKKDCIDFLYLYFQNPESDLKVKHYNCKRKCHIFKLNLFPDTFQYKVYWRKMIHKNRTNFKKKNKGLLQSLTSIVPVNGFVHGQFIHIHTYYTRYIKLVKIMPDLLCEMTETFCLVGAVILYFLYLLTYWEVVH